MFVLFYSKKKSKMSDSINLEDHYYSKQETPVCHATPVFQGLHVTGFHSIGDK